MRGLFVVLGLVGCGSATPRPAPNEWAGMSFAERHQTMTFVTLPNLARAFQRHDGSTDPELACISCHGENAEEVDYHMPNGLFPLDPGHMPAPDHPATRFMSEVVVPRTDATMRAGGTITCFSCHARVGS